MFVYICLSQILFRYIHFHCRFVEFVLLIETMFHLELFPHEDSELIDLAGEDLFSSFEPVSPHVRRVH